MGAVMKQHLKALVVVVILGTLAVWGFNHFFMPRVQQAPTTMVNLEDMEKNGVPNFQAETLTGEKIELSQFKGKVVIVNFWASWCDASKQMDQVFSHLATDFPRAHFFRVRSSLINLSPSCV